MNKAKIEAIHNNNETPHPLLELHRDSMLKSGKALEIYSNKESDLKKFYQGAKQYGIVYCVLRNSKSTPDGLCDILVRADDAPKISRVAERFQFATVDKAKIESEIVAARTEKSDGVEPDAPDIYNTEKLLDDWTQAPRQIQRA